MAALIKLGAQTFRCSDVLARHAADTFFLSGSRNFHTCHVLEKRTIMQKTQPPTGWAKYNDIVYPPQAVGEPRRPAEICHLRSHIKYSPDNLWYICAMLRGKSIDEAIKQMSFSKKSISAIVKEVLEEAQEMAVTDFNVEYKSNLWVADCFSGRAPVIKGLRKHRGPRYGIVHYRYTHFFVRLREGSPPEHYYPPPKTGFEKLNDYLNEMRSRKIRYAL